MVDLNQVVRETLALRVVRAARQPTSTSSRRSPPGLPPVFADPHQIQQVLLNLIINAEQAMLGAHGRGTLDPAHAGTTLDRDAVDPRGERRRPGRAGGRAAADLRSVLHDEGGRQGHRPRADGRLRDRPGARRPDHACKSEPGRGASFFLELPVERRPRARCPTRRPTQPLPDVPQGTRVLVVEDEAGARRRGRRGARRRRVRRRSRRRRRGGARARARARTTT